MRNDTYMEKLALLALAAVASSTLNVRGRFASAAIAPSLYNVSIIAGAAGVALGYAAAWPVVVLVFKAHWGVDWSGLVLLVGLSGLLLLAVLIEFEVKLARALFHLLMADGAGMGQ